MPSRYTLEVIWIRSRTYFALFAPLAGFALLLYGAHQAFLDTILYRVAPSLALDIQNTLPPLGVTPAVLVMLLGVALVGFATR